MIEIAKAEERHIPDIGNLWLEFICFHADIDPVFTPREDAIDSFKEERVRRLMDVDKGLVLVALDGARTVGFSLSEIEEPAKGFKREETGCIHSLAVTADYRSQGVGEKMLAEIMKWFRSRGIARIELEVVAKNQVGYSFWKKHGFTDFRHRLYCQI